jgi:hypothetical protein
VGKTCVKLVTAARCRRSPSAVLSLVLAVTLMATACGGSSEGDGEASADTIANGLPEQPPEAPQPEPPTPVDTAGRAPGPPEPDEPGPPDAPTPTGEVGPDDPEAGPPDPGTPRLEDIRDGLCGQVVEDANEALERSSLPEAEARALRGFAKLCLRESAGDDLVFAEANADELTPATRELLEAVLAADVPQGDELRDVVRDVTRP